MTGPQDSEQKNDQQYGEATSRLINGVFDRGITRAVLLMRHSAREYNAGINDLLNPLTDPGRSYICGAISQRNSFFPIPVDPIHWAPMRVRIPRIQKGFPFF